MPASRKKSDLTRAREILGENEGATCAFVKGERFFFRRDRGVAPLLELYEGGADLAGFSAADRVVGRAAAFLYVLLGVKEIWADVLSAGAEAVLAEAGIGASCGVRTESIVNRAGTGPCPMEEAVAAASDARDAAKRIGEKLRALRGRAPFGAER